MQGQPSEFRARLEAMLDSNGLCADLAAEIEDDLTPVTYEKGAVIFLRGSPGDLLFWLLKGFVKLYLPHSDGNRTLVDVARPGDYLAFVNDEDSKGLRQILEAQALTKCSVGLFTREHLMQLLSKLDQKTGSRLLERLNTAWSTMFERYIAFIGSSFRVRFEIVLNRLGARLGIEDKRGTLLVPELGLEDLAEMIGSSRPMVSKLIAQMTREGPTNTASRMVIVLLRGCVQFLLRDHTRSSRYKGDLNSRDPPAFDRRLALARIPKRKRAEPFRARPLISSRGQTISWPSPCSPVPPPHTVCGTTCGIGDPAA